MTLKHLTAKNKTKDLHVQFREARMCYAASVDLGMSAVKHSLFDCKHSRVKWDRCNEGLMLAENLTKDFVRIGGYAIGMIDRLKLESFEPSDSLE